MPRSPDGGFEGKAQDTVQDVFLGHISGISRAYLGHVSQVEAESAGHGVSQRAEIRGPGAPGVLLRQWQQLTTRVRAPPLLCLMSS